MSATLDKKLFSDYFDGAPVIDIPGRTYPVTCHYLEDLIEETGYVIEEGSRYSIRDFRSRNTISMMVTTRGGEKRKETADYHRDVDVSGRFATYSMSTQM
jgi:HrpA-like RNA helicase